jgi:hypothetical protein
MGLITFFFLCIGCFRYVQVLDFDEAANDFTLLLILVFLPLHHALLWITIIYKKILKNFIK